MAVLGSCLHRIRASLHIIAQGFGFTRDFLKDSLRRDQAINLLNETRLAFGEVGQRVGFTEPAAFSRAFRQSKLAPFNLVFLLRSITFTIKTHGHNHVINRSGIGSIIHFLGSLNLRNSMTNMTKPMP
jgi:hypothetical protein